MSTYPYGGTQIKSLRYIHTGVSNTLSAKNFFSTTNYAPAYHEIAVYNNRLMFANGYTGIGSYYGWTTGSKAALTVTNGSDTVHVDTTTVAVDTRMIGGTILIDAGNDTWLSYIVSSVNTGTNDIILNLTFAGTSGTRRGFCTKQTAGGWEMAGGSTTTMNLSNGTKFFRPMVEFQRTLYVGDGNFIATALYDAATDSLTWTPKAINIGSDYTIKSIKPMGSYLYILADKMSQNFRTDATDLVLPSAESFLFIWDGQSEAITSIVPIGTTCYSILPAENRLYAILRKYSMSGDSTLAISYFNGSDFPTLKSIRASALTYPNGIAYDRGKLFIAVDDGGSLSGVWTYSQYGEEKRVLSFEYPSGGVGG